MTRGGTPSFSKNCLEFKEERGPIHNLAIGDNEFSFLKYMLGGEDFFHNIVKNTNKYAEYLQHSTGKADKDWVDVTYDEMVAYIGVLVYMGIFDLPESRDYWHSQDIDCSIVRDCMTFGRYT